MFRFAVTAILLLSTVVGRAQPVAVDRVIAIVEDDVVLLSDFNDRWTQVQQQLVNAKGPIPPMDVLRKQLLDQLIMENLQLQLAKRAGVRVDDNQLNAAMNNIAGQNNMSLEQFRTALQQQGLYQDTREQLRKEIIISQFQRGAVSQRINITRQEIENYLRSEAGISDTAPEYHVAHILIPGTSDGSEPRKGELADALYQQLMQGGNIIQMAAVRQVSGIAISGGDLGWNKVENLPTLFVDIVPKLQPGEVSKPFTSSSGYHIVQLLETRGGSALKIQQYKVRHIMIKPNEVRTDDQAKALIEDLYKRIQNGEDFADIARQHTDDPTSMVSGGDLDWVNDGMLPDDFMEQVHQAKIGEMSEPFRVSTGWHIIEMMDQRIQDVTEDNKRFQAQQILNQRKFDNELENWLTEIHDTSHIEILDF